MKEQVHECATEVVKDHQEPGTLLEKYVVKTDPFADKVLRAKTDPMAEL